MSGNAAVAVWKTAIKGLQVCCSSTLGLPPDSAEAEEAYKVARLCFQPVFNLPAPLPKAVWKKVVLQQKVPLQLGTLFTTAAAQHSWKSPVMRAAWEGMFLVLNTAPDGGSSLAASTLQQLRQSGMLQSLAAVMTAMAADLRCEAASFAAADWDAAGVDVEQLVVATPHPLLQRVLWIHCRMTMLATGWNTVRTQLPSRADALTWACDPSGHAVAAMQLLTAAAQHASSIVQHVLPILRERAPQQADEQSRRIAEQMQKTQPPAVSLVSLLSDAWSHQQQQGQGIPADSSLQQLLLSPHVLPCLTLMLIGLSADIRTKLSGRRHGKKGGSNRGGGSSSRSTVRSQQQQQQRATGANSSSSGAAGSAPGLALTGCQLQLLQCMDFAPEVVAWMESPIRTANADMALRIALNACTGCYEAVKSLVRLHPATATGTRRIGEQQQRWAAEQKHWLLLQTVLVPCANDLLSPSAQARWQQQDQGPAEWAEQLLLVSRAALHVSALLCEGVGIPSTPPASWAGELLDGLVQVAGQFAEQPLTAGAAAATSAPAGSSSSSSRGRSGSDLGDRAACAGHVLTLLTAVAREKPVQYTWRVLNEQGDSSQGASGMFAISVPPAAAKFVQFGGAFEAALCTITAGMQSGAARPDRVLVDVSGLCAVLLLTHGDSTNDVITQHMGLCGPEALAQEQRQLYSVLSTVLKLGRCRTAGAQLCWGERAASSCCLAAAQAAVSLLRMASPVGTAGSAATEPQSELSPASAAAAAAVPPLEQVSAMTAAAVSALSSAAPVGHGQPASLAAAAAAQQPEVDYLPSLVIFGRCCLQWAEQLQQQATGVLLLALGPLQQGRQLRDALLLEHSAANVCIPGLRQEAASPPSERLEILVAALSGWVSGLGSAACLELLAAAGCSQQQLQQQLNVLLAAQQGTQQGLTDASFTELVQQMQETGRMLCSIAVPHFCNNLACGNISGPTEVWLVSGRSCKCAGCLTARYCGRDCQRAAWKQHKPVCKALAAAAAAAAAVVG